MDVQVRGLQHDDHLHHQPAVVGALILFVALTAATARAQVSVEVTPLRVELAKMVPGASFTQTVTLTNHDKAAIRVRAVVEDWYLSHDGTPQFVRAEGKVPLSAASWLRVNPTEQVLNGGASATVRFTATVPADVAAGGYRAAILFAFSPPGGDIISKGVAIRSRVATMIYATVGAPKAAVELVDVQPREGRGQPPVIVVTVKNTGRVHVRTKGQLLLFDKTGAQVRRLQVPDVPVLPESEREVAIETTQQGQAPLPRGEYRVEIRIDVGLPALLVGETTLTIER